jgi:hypothetical protein
MRPTFRLATIAEHVARQEVRLSTSVPSFQTRRLASNKQRIRVGQLSTRFPTGLAFLRIQASAPSNSRRKRAYKLRPNSSSRPSTIGPLSHPCTRVCREPTLDSSLPLQFHSTANKLLRCPQQVFWDTAAVPRRPHKVSARRRQTCRLVPNEPICIV